LHCEDPQAAALLVGSAIGGGPKEKIARRSRLSAGSRLDVVIRVGHGADPSVFSFSPVSTTLSAPSGSGRCSAFASSHGARIQTSSSSVVVRITGIALGTYAFLTTEPNAEAKIRFLGRPVTPRASGRKAKIG
jgi:hypothetical protein